MIEQAQEKKFNDEAAIDRQAMIAKRLKITGDELKKKSDELQKQSSGLQPEIKAIYAEIKDLEIALKNTEAQELRKIYAEKVAQASKIKAESD